MAKMSIRIILKNGVDFTIKCNSFTLKHNGLGTVSGYNITGISENKPLYLDFNDVSAVIRLISDEILVEEETEK